MVPEAPVTASSLCLSSHSAGKGIAACLFGSNCCRSLFRPVTGTGPPGGVFSSRNTGTHRLPVLAASRGRAAGGVDGQAATLCSCLPCPGDLKGRELWAPGWETSGGGSSQGAAEQETSEVMSLSSLGAGNAVSTGADAESLLNTYHM